MNEKKIENSALNLNSDYISLIDTVVCKVEVDLAGCFKIFLQEMAGKFCLNMKMKITLASF